MSSDNVFGSDELTPELLRSASFADHDGRYDAAEVREFLGRVASSLDVFLSADAPSALRAEFARNAEIAQQVLDAGQNASEHVRRQAGEDAHRILDETREATTRLREEVEAEISRSREQVEGMRGQFIQDLRDLYDRIGASLYRFERAAEESHVAPIQEPVREAAPVEAQQAAPAAGDDWYTGETTPVPVHVAPPEVNRIEFVNESVESSFAPAEPVPPIAPELPEPHPLVADEAPPLVHEGAMPSPGGEAEVELPEGAKPPAWQQLPPEAWAGAPGTEPQQGEEPASSAEPGAAFAVVEDEPLAPGEPLVDLRALQDTVDSTSIDAPVTTEASWLDATDDAGGAAPAPDELTVVDATPPVAEAGWLVDTPADIAGPVDPSDPALQHDDALAEALIAGLGEDDDAAAPPPPPADTGTIAPDLSGASPDSLAVRQLILDSLAAGQSRTAIETYLRDHMGFMEPGTLIDAALGSAGTA